MTQSTILAVVMVLMAGAWSMAAAPFPEVKDLPVRKELPDPLVMLDGTRVTTAEQWRTQRVPELRALFQHYMYGYFPAPPEKIKYRVEHTDTAYLGGKAIRKLVTIQYPPNGAPPIHLLLVMPAKARPAPVFMGINFCGNHTLLNDPLIPLPTTWMPTGCAGVVENKATEAGRGGQEGVWNVEMIIDRGYALANFYVGDIDPDRADFTDGIHPHFLKEGQKRPGKHDWGTIASWAWGIHRAVDYLHQDADIDPRRIACVGHSRNGKTALLAAAFDERIDLVIPLQAGCGGTAPSRTKNLKAETVKIINKNFPHWFNDAFTEFDEQVEKLPFDQHCLIALCAPRPVLLPNAVEDQWADPQGQFENLVAADPVYKLLGSDGLASRRMPEVGKVIDSPLGYWIRAGEHAMTGEDWKIFLDFADRHFRAVSGFR